MSKKGWRQVCVAGVIWAAVYNGLWGLAWLASMRHAWTKAAVTVGQTMPWMPEFWAVWVPTTPPFGMAVGAYLLKRPDYLRIHRDAAVAGLVIWVPGTVGMAFGAALTPDIIVLDAIVNLAAVLAPSLMLGELVRRRMIRMSRLTEHNAG